MAKEATAENCMTEPGWDTDTVGDDRMMSVLLLKDYETQLLIDAIADRVVAKLKEKNEGP